VPQPRHRALRVVLALLFGLLAVLPLALPAFAAGQLSMTARVLLQGHARVGSWMAIEIQLTNDGPAISGELRMDAGSGSTTRFSMQVDLPTSSRQTYVLHAQAPAFARSFKVDLIANGTSVASQTVAYLVHDAGQLVVGVLAEQPKGIVAELNLPASPTGAAAVIVPLSVTDLPDRVEGWGALDRLIWQDIDSNTLSPGQLTALRAWLAGGGRLVIAGGTAGIGTLSAFPDDLLPFRPSATLDLDPANLSGLLGEVPASAGVLPSMAGTLTHGQALATSGDRVVAAQMPYGSWSVTLIGFDPSTPWLAQGRAIDSFWRGLLPARTSGDGSNLADDSQLLQALQALPSLQLPPIGGLLIVLAAYIVVVGPLNYLVLRRLDRREWAWVSVPLLVVGFAAASYGYGAVLRGTDVVVNEVAIIRGAPDTTEGRAQDYFGIFSPTRATYLVEIPGGALLAAPISDPFGTGAGLLDIVQGDPAEVRDLAVGVTQLRTIRADTATSVPHMNATLTLTAAGLTGTFQNNSDETLEQVSIVLGGSAVVIGDVAAHTSKDVTLTLQASQFGGGLADRLIGSNFGGGSEEDVRRQIRYGIINQLSFDPVQGFLGQLQSDQPVILAFGRRSPLDIQISGQTTKRTTNVLYYVPVSVAVHGTVTFTSDLVRATVLSSQAQFFNKAGPGMFGLGVGTLVVAYRPIPFQGTLVPSALRIGFNSNGGSAVGVGGQPVEPLATIPPACTNVAQTAPPGCAAPRQDFLPELEIFDRSGTGTWVRLPRLSQDAPYTVQDPTRYVDPTSGQVLVRFVNDNPNNGLNFGFGVSIEGEVR